MTTTTSVSAGGLTIAGFSSDDTQAGAFSSGYLSNEAPILGALSGGLGAFGANLTGSGVDDYIFNWSGPDTFGNQGQVVLDGGSTSTDAWSLKITGLAWGGNTAGSEVLQSGGNALLDMNGSTYTATGSGESSLISFVQTLNVQNPTGEDDSFAIQFDLTDSTTSSGPSSVTEYFAACYLAGTRVAVPSGELAVETLRAGDLVVTATGEAKAIKWIGRRSYTAAQLAANKQLRPVMVRKDALAAGMPHRDLLVSAMHALYIDDVFIPAASLVNGVSILRHDELAPATYVHVELEDHDVIFAEGAAAETYVDDNSRLMFDNADEYYDQFGATEAKPAFSAPRIEEGFQLEAIRNRLAARAGIAAAAKATGELRGHVERLEDGVLQGWVLDTATTTPVELDVLVDGESFARVIANRYRVDLDRAGLAGGRCAFTLAMPAAVTSLAQVEVRRAADGRKLAQPQTAALVG